MAKQIFFAYSYEYSQEIRDWKNKANPGSRLFGLDQFFDKKNTLYHGHYLQVTTPLIPKAGALFKLYQACYFANHQQQYQAVVCFFESTGYWFLLLKALHLIKKPIIVFNVALLQPQLIHGWRKTILRILLQQADGIISYAHCQHKELQRIFSLPKEKLTYMPLCIDTNYFTPVKKKTNKFILSVGTNYGKDFGILFDIAQDIPQDIHIITDAKNRRQLLTRKNIPKNIIIHPKPISPKTLYKYYTQATLVVLPLHPLKVSLGQTVLLESMAMGNCVIISDIPSVHDYITDTACISIPPRNATALKNTIIALLANKKQRELYQKNARRYVQTQHSLNQTQAYLIRILDRCIASTKS